MPPDRRTRTGDRFVLTSEPITTRQLVMYAGASGDFNLIHYDQDFARSAGLGGVIAHGMLTMAIAGRCVTDWAGAGWQVRSLSGRFLHPVRPGDQVEITLTVTGTDEAVALDLRGAVEDKHVFTGSAEVIAL